ncbi:MAG: hypothetical protein NC517_11300, partial [Firmicutes bacterium]|nr:hypothetical protein [Bacillota bacterium]
RQEWTADRHLCGRIRESTEYMGWIPDFRYEVVRLHDHSDEELLERGNEMSLIMLINKIQDAADLERFMRIPPERINRIIRDSPEHILEVLVTVMENLCFRINVSAEERLQCVRKVRARDMGYLWENMEKIDIQAERRKVQEERRKADEERRKADEERRKTEEQRIRAEDAEKKVAEACRRADEAEEKLRLAEEKIRQLQERGT